MDAEGPTKATTPRRAGLGGATTESAAPAAFERTEFCENCRAGAFSGTDQVGRCRIKPPQAVIVPLREAQLGGGVESTTLADWPPVARKHWCCEWKPLPKDVQ